MNDLLKAYTSNFKKKSKFKMKYKSKKFDGDSIVIHSKHWKKQGVFHPRLFGKEPIRAASEQLPDKLDYDTRLHRTRYGEYYLCILKPLEILGDNQIRDTNNNNNNGGERIVALDPGVRTFMTSYSPSGQVYHLNSEKEI